ncbi:hypothetical protein [Alkaliphilus hydrothermalis]|uniref:Uncharacterized protein n=1 Tax=Alkaliphilus hydrothermalis TaxID=1482730 RepID=A0ABS2NP53_9FIRM|nr:hypothetical protein [Alkaliphilus hydrothermalis]MBM7614731.1 hypothetical protein [Alkaliphilus hydrothermalis]
MNQEVIKDLGNMSYANLSQSQLAQLQEIEGEINANRQDKVFLMALVK